MFVPHDPGSTLPPISTSTESVTPPVNNQSTPNATDDSERIKHFSIERSLELEHQLELEGDSSTGSPPRTPSLSTSSISYTHQPPNLNDSLDPQILVHIITGLRKTVEDMTKERDDLLKLLDSATTREASLQDTLALMTEKATDYEEELSTAKKKMKEDEEAIALLRNKVEESRRGVMRLQAESRRQSVQISQAPGSLDLSRASISGLGLTTPLTSASSKRASFTPLTGRSNIGGSGHGHRRVSSIAGDGNGLGGLQLPMELNNSRPNSPNSQQSLFSGHDGLPPSSARRSLFRYSPPNTEPIPLPPTTNIPSPELEALKRDSESLKKELAHARVELAEANEAKEASDECVKTLRAFIAENQVGILNASASSDSSGSVKIQPPPTSMLTTATPSSGWGFKIWKADNTPKLPISTTSVSTPASTSTSAPTQPSIPTTTVTTTAVSAPFSRLGGFFSSRMSVPSSTTTPSSGSSSLLQTNAALPLTRELKPSSSSHRDSISTGHSVSVVSDDASSVVEPASPQPQGTNDNNIVKVALHDVPEIGGESTTGMIREIPSSVVEKESIQQQQPSATVFG